MSKFINFEIYTSPYSGDKASEWVTVNIDYIVSIKEQVYIVDDKPETHTEICMSNGHFFPVKAKLQCLLNMLANHREVKNYAE